MPLWNSSEIAVRGLMSPRIHDGSPVMCTSEHKSAGTLTSSSAAAMASSPSVKGSPACGLRSDIALTIAPARIRSEAGRLEDQLLHGRRAFDHPVSLLAVPAVA